MIRARAVADGGVAFSCPACNEAHVAPGKMHDGSRGWTWNENVERPTITPSLSIAERERWDGTKKIMLPSCHCVVTDGRIYFDVNSGHALAGQTLDLPEFRW